MPDAAEADRVGTIEAEEGHAVSGQDGGADATVHTTNANAEHAAEDSDQEAMLGEDVSIPPQRTYQHSNTGLTLRRLQKARLPPSTRSAVRYTGRRRHGWPH